MAMTVARPPTTVPTMVRDRVVLRGVSWATYQSLLADFVDCQTPRFAYDRGALEIVVTLSSDHEETKRTVEFLIDLVAGVAGIDVRRVGGMTFRRADIQGGFEPDSSYYVQREPDVRGRARIDPAIDPPPDLVLEVDVSRVSFPKLPLFASFGVPEVWRFDEGRIGIHLLHPDGYHDSAVSRAIPFLTDEAINRFLAESQSQPSSRWMQTVQDWVKDQAATS